MWSLLSKFFILRFYRDNVGFFLFFFFIFFGAVEGSTIISYHYSLMRGMLSSVTVLQIVLFFWTLYHLKCGSFFLRRINSEEGKFIYNLQCLSTGRQWLLYVLLYTAVYAPVLIYALLVTLVGWKEGYIINATLILLFQFFSIALFSGIIHYRQNHWLNRLQLPLFQIPLRKVFTLTVFYHLLYVRKSMVLFLKSFSLLLLYIILVWNRGRYDNDSFMLFYLVIFLAHAVLPYMAVQFWENNFPSYRNLPVSLLEKGLGFLLCYSILLVPEALYLLYVADAFSLLQKLGYMINLVASLSLLTAIQYSEAQSREEYAKATFAVFFISIFVLHVQAFWFWIALQFTIAAILFASGYYKYEKQEG